MNLRHCKGPPHIFEDEPRPEDEVNRHQRRRKEALKRKGKKKMEDKAPEETIDEDELREQEIRAKNGGFLHKEAFCMMDYCCKNCNRIERIWNSRDGVTPFGCHCLCGGDMRHINWSGDRRDVNHLPKRGDRIFIDTPQAIHAIYMKIRVDQFWLDSSIPKPAETKEEVIQQLLKSWRAEDPYLLTWG